VQLNGKTYHPGQGNNLYIFPGLGLGACTIGAAKISDSMVLVSAETLASMVSVCGLPYFRWTLKRLVLSFLTIPLDVLSPIVVSFGCHAWCRTVL
jgi:hypothetical protein